MGKRGPDPTPTSTLRLHGSRLVKDREKRLEPTPPVGVPDAPSFLNGDDQRAYQSLVGKLQKTPGMLTILDGALLERYARYLVRWRSIEKELERFRGMEIATLKSKDTRQILRLLWQESRLMDTALKQIEDEFGLSPKARVGLAMKHAEQRSALDDSMRKDA